MRIYVKAKAGAKEEKIIAPEANLWSEKEKGVFDNKESFVVWVKEPPVHGKANIAILNVLAKYFKLPASKIRLISGFSSKQKVFEIEK